MDRGARPRHEPNPRLTRACSPLRVDGVEADAARMDAADDAILQPGPLGGVHDSRSSRDGGYRRA